MIPVRGYATQSSKSPLAPFKFERRDPRPDDVLIDILYCGICHSDIHTARGEWGESLYPVVPGHEIAGRVKAVGSKVKNFKAGDSVGVGCFVDSCRSCPSCKKHLEPYCDKLPIFTYNSHEKDGSPTYGGYSTQIVVDKKYVFKIPPKLPLDRAAPL